MILKCAFFLSLFCCLMLLLLQLLALNMTANKPFFLRCKTRLILKAVVLLFIVFTYFWKWTPCHINRSITCILFSSNKHWAWACFSSFYMQGPTAPWQHCLNDRLLYRATASLAKAGENVRFLEPFNVIKCCRITSVELWWIQLLLVLWFLS